MVYKVKKSIVVLAVLLMVTILCYGFSLFYTNVPGYGKYIVISILGVLIFLNLLQFLINKVIIDENIITVKSLYGTKRIDINELQEISFVPLQGRILMMLTDKNSFAFIPSTIDGFDDIAEYIKGRVDSIELVNILNEINMKVINSKNRMIIIFLIVFNVILIVSSLYNFK
ncbi:MAG: hypothetical protein K6348_07225 [Deferribacterales bacterium]